MCRRPTPRRTSRPWGRRWRGRCGCWGKPSPGRFCCPRNSALWSRDGTSWKHARSRLLDSSCGRQGSTPWCARSRSGPAFLTLLDVPVEDPYWQALGPPQRRQRLLDAIKRLVLRMSQAQPLLLIVENLHWIDTETQACLDSLVESLPTAPLLLLVTYRPEYPHG